MPLSTTQPPLLVRAVSHYARARQARSACWLNALPFPQNVRFAGSFRGPHFIFKPRSQPKFQTVFVYWLLEIGYYSEAVSGTPGGIRTPDLLVRS